MPEEHDEDAKPKCAPVFVSKPESVTVEEGEWARFQARVTGHPRPRVMWLINGHTVVNVSLIQTINIWIPLVIIRGKTNCFLYFFYKCLLTLTQKKFQI